MSPGDGKTAPVQGWAEPIPWDVHLRAWERYNRRFRGQSADEIARRGGFSTNEMDAFNPSWRDDVSRYRFMERYCSELLNKLRAREPTQAEGDAAAYTKPSGAPDDGGDMASECWVDGWTWRRCRHCGKWVWGGPTACVPCADIADLCAKGEAVRVAMGGYPDSDLASLATTLRCRAELCDKAEEERDEARRIAAVLAEHQWARLPESPHHENYLTAISWAKRDDK